MSDFAKNLKRFRKQKGYSQQKLAKALDYGYTAIANYESGRNEPSLDTLVILADTLDVSVDELLGVKLKSEEKRLLIFFKKLNNEKKKMILDLLNALQS